MVDELIVSFTHDTEMPVLLPGIPPTGKKVELAHVVVAGFQNGKVAYEHIYWDQASLLVQIGMLDHAIAGDRRRAGTSIAQYQHQVQRPHTPG